MSDFICGKIRSGHDTGQRFEVRCQRPDGEPMVVGWATTTEAAARLMRMVELHHVWHSPVVEDRLHDESKGLES